MSTMTTEPNTSTSQEQFRDPIDYLSAPPPPRRGPRINVRLMVFLLAVASPFLWFGYVFVHQELTQGIERHGQYVAVDLKALGNFPFDGINGTVNDIPARYRNLDGKKVELEGFMYALDSADHGVNNFQFVYNITKCCFSGPPLVQERVFAHVPEDIGRVPLFDSMVRLTGTLHIDLHKEGGKIQTVYIVDVEKVEPV